MQENTQQKNIRQNDEQIKDRKADDTLASNPEGVETTDKADLESGAKKDKAHEAGSG